MAGWMTTSGRGRGVALVATASLLLSLLLGLGRVHAADPELARFLLQGGKDDLAKGNAADALTKLTKAREEDPSLAEVAYWMGAALEARGNVPAAVEEYRTFLK